MLKFDEKGLIPVIAQDYKTNKAFHQEVLKNKKFKDGILSTVFLEEEIINGNS